jgi:hypothetical protein
VLQDDHLPMLVQNANDRDAILGIVWLSMTEQAELTKYVGGILATFSEF